MRDNKTRVLFLGCQIVSIGKANKIMRKGCLPKIERPIATPPKAAKSEYLIPFSFPELILYRSNKRPDVKKNIAGISVKAMPEMTIVVGIPTILNADKFGWRECLNRNIRIRVNILRSRKNTFTNRMPGAFRLVKGSKKK